MQSCLKWLPGLECVVGDGIGDSNKMCIAGGSEPDFSRQCYGHDRIDVVTEDKWGKGGRDRGDVAGADVRPVVFERNCRCWNGYLFIYNSYCI